MAPSSALKLVIPNLGPGSAVRPGRRRPRIAVVIPAYNEQANIERVLQEIATLQGRKPEWDIVPIVVNDGSTDQTEAILNQIAPKYRAQIVSLPVNLGIGGAVQAGFKLAVRLHADVTLQLDGDGQHPAEEIPAIVEPVLNGTAEVVVGSRYVNQGTSGIVSSSARYFGTLLFSKLLRLLVGVRIADTTSGFRAFSSEATEFLAQCYPDDYPEVEAYVPLARKKFVISEVGVRMRPRKSGTSSITPIRSVYYMIKVSFATMLDVIRPLPARRKQIRGFESTGVEE